MYRGKGSALLDAIDRVRDAILTFTGIHAPTHNPNGTDPLTTGAPVEISDTNISAGSANSYARADHVHAHGARGGGTLHAVATPASAGFMSSTDKVKLDGLRKITPLAKGPTTVANNTTTTLATLTGIVDGEILQAWITPRDNVSMPFYNGDVAETSPGHAVFGLAKTATPGEFLLQIRQRTGVARSFDWFVDKVVA